ncbi:MAG: GAF domain-containing sensor histidine kinase [Anaerolineales bacterium]
MDKQTLADNTKLLDGYRRLIDISRDLASTLDLNPLLNRIVRAAADITGAEAASILLYDDTSRQLFFQVATNDMSSLRGLAVPLNGSIAGWIVTNRQPVRISNVDDDTRYYRQVSNATDTKTRSLIGIPLITKEKVIGVLEVLNKVEGEFSDTDEDLLTVLGAQAAVAIENTRLFQQSDLISEFVHELRTPLSSMSTATYLLLRPEISREQSEQIIHNIHNEALRLNALATSFLDLARLESGRVQFRMVATDVPKLFSECIEIMTPSAQENDVRLSIDVPVDFPIIQADRDKLKQVILNLLSNAIKYNRPGGSATLKADYTEHDCILTVQDTGLGIPKEAQAHLFEKFYRVKKTENKIMGTGLGLSIVKQIVLGHNGTIAVQSEPNQGTAFIITLPRR